MPLFTKREEGSLGARFTLALGHVSLVFICRENPRRTGIILFVDHPRFADISDNRQKSVPDSRETPCLFVIGGLEPSNLGDF